MKTVQPIGPVQMLGLGDIIVSIGSGIKYPARNIVFCLLLEEMTKILRGKPSMHPCHITRIDAEIVTNDLKGREIPYYDIFRIVARCSKSVIGELVIPAPLLSADAVIALMKVGCRVTKRFPTIGEVSTLRKKFGDDEHETNCLLDYLKEGINISDILAIARKYLAPEAFEEVKKLLEA